MSSYPTRGPRHRFGAALFIEKEGFLPLFRAVRLAERFDLATLSSKGMPVTACRALVDHVCGKHRIPLLVLHDFDKAGFSILATLRNDGRRYRYEHDFEVIDLGLRLQDIEQYGLDSEDVAYGTLDPRRNLIANGATADEVNFLVTSRDAHGRYYGQRVELNAFTSDQLVDWIETKLRETRVEKVIPPEKVLADAYRLATERALFKREIARLTPEIHERAQATDVPADLAQRVRKRLAQDATLPWDAAIAEMIEPTSYPPAQAADARPPP